MHASLRSLVIRRALRTEVPDILRLYAEDALSAARESTSSEVMNDYLEAFDEVDGDGRTLLYVAELAACVIGTFQLTLIRHLTHRGARVAQVEAVHVAAEHRRRGIGDAMMRFAMEEARRRGCRRMQLTSDKRRTDAHRFYERLGFVASHEGMKLAL